MFYSLPPVPPAMAYVEVAPTQGIDILIAEDCERGSRDCFPTDRVGYETEDAGPMALRPWNNDSWDSRQQV